MGLNRETVSLWLCPGSSDNRRGLSPIGLVHVFLLRGAQALSLQLYVSLWLSGGSKEGGFGANQTLPWWQLGKIPGV